MKPNITPNLVPFLVGGLCFILLNYLGNFSVRQSVFLALVLVLIVAYIEGRFSELSGSIKNSNKIPTYKFVPYHVRIDPQWQHILGDLKVIEDNDDWERLKRDVYEALPYGISCTILKKPDDLSEGLIYRDSILGSFVRKLEFEDVIAPIQFGEAPNRLRLFVERGADGYDLGVIVPEKWWDVAKEVCFMPLKVDSGKMWYEAKLTLATLPCVEFDWYWQPESQMDPGQGLMREPQHVTYEEWHQQIVSRRDEQRTKHGWTNAAEDGWPERIEHRYFEVTHAPI